MNMITRQLQYFLASFLWGVLLLFLYDLLRTFRRLLRHGHVWRGIEDVLFFAINSYFVFRMIFERNYGMLRGFFLVALAGGMLLYYMGVGNHVVNGLTAIMRTIQKPIRFFWKKVLKKYGKAFIMALRAKLRR